MYDIFDNKNCMKNCAHFKISEQDRTECNVYNVIMMLAKILDPCINKWKYRLIQMYSQVQIFGLLWYPTIPTILLDKKLFQKSKLVTVVQTNLKNDLDSMEMV